MARKKEKIPGKMSFDLAPKNRRVLRAAATAALLNGLGLAGCFGAGGGDGQDDSDDDDEDRLLGFNGVVEMRRKDGRIRRPLPWLPSNDGVPIASALRDLEPVWFFCFEILRKFVGRYDRRNCQMSMDDNRKKCQRGNDKKKKVKQVEFSLPKSRRIGVLG
jgi:hypothetical protein